MSQTNKCQTSGVHDVKWNLWSCWDHPLQRLRWFQRNVSILLLVGLWMICHIPNTFKSYLKIRSNVSWRFVFYPFEVCNTKTVRKNIPPMNCSKQKHWIWKTPPPYPHSLHSIIYPYKYPLNRRFLFTKPPLTHSNKIQGSRLRFFQLQGLLGCNHRSPSDRVKRCETTVDGSEIRRSPVDMVNFPIIYRVFYIQKVVSRSSEPSTVVLLNGYHISPTGYPWQLVTVVGKLVVFLTYLRDEINLRIQGWKDIHWS